MKSFIYINVLLVSMVLIMIGCTDVEGPSMETEQQDLAATLSGSHGQTGALIVNGWYEEEEIYYIDGGIEEGITERGENDIFLIGAPRLHQANVVEFIPGERGYSPHWNVHVVHTAEGKTVQDILNSEFASSHFETEGVLFDDAEDIRGAYRAGLVTIFRPGVVVLCPVVPEKAADAPGNTEAPEVFEPFGTTF